MGQFKRYIFLFILLTSLGIQSKAQDYKYEIGVSGGAAYYVGDLNPFGVSDLHVPFGGLARYNLNFRWALRADLIIGKLSGKADRDGNAFFEGALPTFSRNFVDLGIGGEFNFFPYSDKFKYKGTKRFTPYIASGTGLLFAGGEESLFAPYLGLGAGLKYKLTDRINLGCRLMYKQLFSDALDAPKKGDVPKDPYKLNEGFLKNGDGYMSLMFSITWDFSPRRKPCNRNNGNNGAQN